VAIVVYISNIIAVNRLASEVSHLQAQYDKILNANAVLKAEINRKSSWDRIGKVATEQVGLRYPKEQPTMFEIDEELMDKATKK
ncbi:MAG: septum formation initiator family protein, partial [Bacteroidota bacterium]